MVTWDFNGTGESNTVPLKYLIGCHVDAVLVGRSMSSESISMKMPLRLAMTSRKQINQYIHFDKYYLLISVTFKNAFLGVNSDCMATH